MIQCNRPFLRASVSRRRVLGQFEKTISINWASEKKKEKDCRLNIYFAHFERNRETFSYSRNKVFFGNTRKSRSIFRQTCNRKVDRRVGEHFLNDFFSQQLCRYTCTTSNEQKHLWPEVSRISAYAYVKIVKYQSSIRIVSVQTKATFHEK